MPRLPTKLKQIEEAAIFLFASKGIAETSVKNIAARAGVAEGALYRHFPSKNEMAWVLFQREVQSFTDAFLPLLKMPEHTFAERIREAVRFLYRFYLDHPQVFSFILLTRHNYPEEAALADTASPQVMLTRFLAAGMKAKNMPRGDANLLAGMLLGAVLEPVALHRSGRLVNQPIELTEEVTQACLGLLSLPR